MYEIRITCLDAARVTLIKLELGLMSNTCIHTSIHVLFGYYTKNY